MSRLGNAWLATEQAVIDDFVARRESENSDPPGTYVSDMDDETYRIMSETLEAAETVDRTFKPVNTGDKTYKLFSYYMRGTIEVKQDIDYLVDNNDMTAIGSWWFDTGIQGGMQPAVDPEDPPTGTPFYDIPNNAWMFMPDITVYDANGNPVGTIVAEDNSDLRDTHLMLGQVPRDLVTGAMITINMVGSTIITAGAMPASSVGYKGTSPMAGSITVDEGDTGKLTQFSTDTIGTGELTMFAEHKVTGDPLPQNIFESVQLLGQTFLSADATYDGDSWVWDNVGFTFTVGSDYVLTFA